MRKFLYFLSTAFMTIAITGCGGSETEGGNATGSGISISIDKTFILSDGTDYVTIKVEQALSDGSLLDITDEAEIYVNNERQPLSSNKFSTDKAGEYTFYAVYDINISEETSLFAYNELPVAPQDTQTSNTTFKHRIMLVQHTGTACVNCPRMMESLKELAADEAYNTAYTHIACHSYLDPSLPDPCASEAASNFSRLYNPEDTYPCLTFNFTKNATGTALTEIRREIDALRKESVNVGIAADAIESNGDLLVDINVKVAQPGDYRVGVWVLEDDIYGIQSGASESWHNTHENALRATITNAGSKTIMVGEPAEELKNGKNMTKTFRITPEEGWKPENCKFMIYVTVPSGDSYDLVNSVVCHVGEAIQFDYK